MEARKGRGTQGTQRGCHFTFYSNVSFANKQLQEMNRFGHLLAERTIATNKPQESAFLGFGYLSTCVFDPSFAQSLCFPQTEVGSCGRCPIPISTSLLAFGVLQPLGQLFGKDEALGQEPGGFLTNGRGFPRLQLYIYIDIYIYIHRHIYIYRHTYLCIYVC